VPQQQQTLYRMIPTLPRFRSTYEAKRLLQALRGLDIIGTDLVEVSPPFDSAGITALAGAQMMFEMLCLATESFAKRSKT
jgi:hypothetical protein